MLEVDRLGLDIMDRKLLLAVIEKFAGGPVGIDNLAAAVGEEHDTLEDVVEPYLIQQGLLQRTPRGRVAGVGYRPSASFSHAGYAQPTSCSDVRLRCCAAAALALTLHGFDVADWLESPPFANAGPRGDSIGKRN